MTRRFSLRTIAFLAWMLVAGQALAKAYPTLPIRMLVPFAVGGTVDIVARFLGAS